MTGVGRIALGNDTPSPSRGAALPRFCIDIVPRNQEGTARPSSEGAGNAGCAARTRGPCAKGSKHTAVTTGTAANRHSPRNGFNGFLRALPGDRALLSPSPVRCEASSPVQCGTHCHQLDASVGASEPHDFAVRFSASRLARRSVHRIPHPTFVTIAKRPSYRGGTAREMRLICRKDQLRHVGTTGKSAATRLVGRMGPR
jgi:hypothetical protein